MGGKLGDDWDDLEAGAPDLELSRSGGHKPAQGPSAYGSGGGLGLGDDDPFADDAPAAELELDAPAGHPSNTRVSAAPQARPSVSQAPVPQIVMPQASLAPAPVNTSAAPPAPPQPAAPPPRDPVALIARYPDAPSRIWETPVYAIKVLWRQLELKQDLSSLRRRRSPDVPLYERALTLHDAKAFTLGLILTCTALLLATVLFFMPVILRFVRSPD